MMTLNNGTPVSVASHDRMFGLDLCRTMAIVSVVIGHMLLYSSPNAYLASIGYLAIFGVDLFFCLREALNNSVWLKARRGFLLGLLKQVDFVSDLSCFRWFICQFPPSRRTLGLSGEQPSAGHEEIGQSEQRE